jgi:hypothetical protein
MRTHTHIHTLTHIHTYTHTYALTHAHIHTLTHTHMPNKPFKFYCDFYITEPQISLQAKGPFVWLLPRVSLYLQLFLEANNDKFRNHNDYGESFPPESVKITCEY